MTDLAPRPPIDLHLPEGTVIERLETYRRQRAWWQFWKPKYDCRLYALTPKGVYDVTEVIDNLERQT